MNKTSTFSNVKTTESIGNIKSIGIQLNGKLIRGLALFCLLMLSSAHANATIWLTIKNTGCQTMKVYKNSFWGESYQTSLNANATWTTISLWNDQYTYRKTDGTWLGSYTTTVALTQTDNFNAGGGPTVPVIGNITPANCTVSTGSVALSGLPASGTWTLTRNPGNITSTGTGTSTTVSGLAPGTYTFKVANSTGCISNATGNVVISLQTSPPGTACNDGNPNTSNDVVQADGCTCAGTAANTPNCTTGITITTGSGNISVTGLGVAPVSSLQVFSATWQQVYSCFANCGASQTVNVPAGTYVVIAKYYTAGYALICEKNQSITVSGGSSPCANQGGDTDGDGICNNTDCAPNNAALPAPPGTSCNDGNPTTINDVIQPGGCACAGTPVNPCANQGGDTDGDGVCNNTDCAPNNASLPAPPGTACNDGNPNTTNDVIQPGGCTCAGTATNTPDCNTGVTITTSAGSITVAGLGGAPVSSLQVFNSTWQPQYSCFANCGASQTVNVPAGSYIVIVKYYTAGYALICEKNQTVTVGGSSPCANLGGDTDGDGVCNNTDCAPTNAALPTAPGTTCNDNNPNTTNDVIQPGGCICAGTPTSVGTLLPPATHPKFVNQLPAPPRINATNGGQYNITMDEGSYYMGLTDTNGSPMNTTAWGYTYNGVKMHLGPTFITMKNVPVDVRWMNNFNYGHTHLLPIDHSIHMAHPALGIPTVAHLHGGHTEAASDGHPEAWFTKSFVELGPNWVKDNYHYSLDQEASMIWYHDHALGFTRLNVYAGLAGMWLHRDQNELSLNLPSGNYEREMVIQDKSFSPNGQLFFPSDPGDPLLPNPSIMPEFFGDYIMVNGMVWPVLDVAPTKYRFRVLNGSDSRFYVLKLSNGASFKQIGTDGGLLNTPVTLTQLLISPGERADLIIDFSGLSGQQIVLQNIGPDAPYQGVDATTGAVIGGPADPATTGQVMMFRVNQPNGTAYNLPTTLRQPIQFLGTAQNTRQVLLYEGTDEFGRILPSLGTVTGGQMGWLDPVSETPRANDIEIWEIYNTTMDAHPIHLHQISFEILDRQEFMATQDPVTGALSNIMLMGTPIAPAANEKGWKDTGVNLPMTRTRYKVKFDIPGSFVWHCHILSHEDHDMMRPLEVLPAGSTGGGGSGNTPNCANVHVMASTGNIHIGGLDGAPITSIEIFTSSWQPYFSCFGNCGASKMVSVAPGTYYVKVKYFTANYQTICEVNQTVTVTSAIAGAFSEEFRLFSNQFEEHVEVRWTHNWGMLAEAYILEKSLDGVNFKEIGQDVSRGGQAIEMYAGHDFQPATGDNYYHVKIKLLDGSFRYSDVVMAHFDDLEDYILFPNPASDFVKMNLEAVVGMKDVNIQIFDNLGVLQKTLNIDEVSGKYYQLDLRNLHEGHYIVWLNVPGKRAIPKSLVISKI